MKILQRHTAAFDYINKSFVLMSFHPSLISNYQSSFFKVRTNISVIVVCDIELHIIIIVLRLWSVLIGYLLTDNFYYGFGVQ